MSEIDLLSKLRDLLPELSEQQQKAANYILDNYKQVAFLTTTQLSRQCGASAATINRLCVSLKMSGYMQFQTQLQTLVQAELTAIDRIKDEKCAKDTLSDVFEKEAETLQNVVNRISRSQYKKALKLLLSKKKLFIVGHQACEPAALYAAYSLGKVRSNVERLDLGQLDSLGKLNAMTNDDVALVFGMPRYPVRTVQMIEELNIRKIPFILISHNESTPYSQLATVNLCLPIRYHRFTDGLSPLFCLINAFALDLLEANNQEGKKNLEQFEKLTKYLFVKSRHIENDE